VGDFMEGALFEGSCLGLLISQILLCIHAASDSASCSLDIWKLSQNSVEPMGKPKMWRPSVTLTGMPLLREYWLWFVGERTLLGGLEVFEGCLCCR